MLPPDGVPWFLPLQKTAVALLALIWKYRDFHVCEKLYE